MEIFVEPAGPSDDLGEDDGVTDSDDAEGNDGGTSGGTDRGTTDTDLDQSVIGEGLDIWWPIENSEISGLQPLKILVPDTDLRAYDAYWQVDGDRLNPMYDSYEDWAHKEAYIDVTDWDWNEWDIYNINFIIKDKSGNTVRESAVDVRVVHW